MKVRMGFVSNSSSSSFLIYGVALERYFVVEKCKKSAEPKSEDEDEDEDEYEEDSYELIERLGGQTASDGDDHAYFGNSWDDVKDDETGKQFKERTEMEVKTSLKNAGFSDEDIAALKFQTHSEAWFG